jgi:hypothetical protein
MNLDPHWLKERYSNIPTDDLKTLVIWTLNEQDKAMYQAELKRREDESK